jgi:HEAT repeat protein
MEISAERGRPCGTRDGSFRGRFVAAIALAAMALAGCRVDEDDIRRWETTLHGPEKLDAVLLHPKYDTSLRVEAALALIRMKPRGGKAVGLSADCNPNGPRAGEKCGLIETLAKLSPEERHPILAGLVPAIIAELKKPPTPTQSGVTVDATFPYKDAAYAMLTYEGKELITDQALKTSLKSALGEWAMADFENRIENRNQQYSTDQLLRYLGPTSITGVPKLMTRDTKRLDKMATLVAEFGDDATKEAASKAVVDIAKYVLSDEWVKVTTPKLQAANAASKLEPTEKQFKAQLQQFQDEELMRVLGALKKVGGAAAADFALALGADKNQATTRRQAALAAVERRLDPKNPKHVEAIVAIAGDPTAPPEVLDQAFRRISEMPREAVADKLTTLMNTDKWKVRRAAATTLLRMSTLKQLDAFMNKLPSKTSGFAMPEAITYGATIGDLKEGNPREAIKPYLDAGSANVRTTAISYYFQYGTKADLPALEPLMSDSTKAPSCDEDPECKWACYVPKEGNPKETELKDVGTVGDYVKFCIVPAIEKRAAEAAAEKPGDKAGGEPAGDKPAGGGADKK